ncbi:MAG: hypothetical protein KDA89_08405 [Planctomycetaceae bacterium]|nr:hypothetical protein [Planctomycetaceae bacterium]
MQDHFFDLEPGQSVRLGEYRVTLLEVDGQAAVLEIDGPDGFADPAPVSGLFEEAEICDEAVVLV